MFALGGGGAGPGFERPALVLGRRRSAGRTTRAFRSSRARPAEPMALANHGFRFFPATSSNVVRSSSAVNPRVAAVPLVRQPNRIVERLRAVGEPADVRIEQERHDVALAVVADGALAGADARVAVGPDFRGRLLERLHQASGRLLEVGDRRRHRAQKLLGRHQSRAREHQVAQIRRRAFRDPQARRGRRVLVVERAELDRPQPLDVEGVEVLVRDKREPPLRRLRGLWGSR